MVGGRAVLAVQSKAPEAAQHDRLCAQADLFLVLELARLRVELPIEELPVPKRAKKVGDLLKHCQQHRSRNHLPS